VFPKSCMGFDSARAPPNNPHSPITLYLIAHIAKTDLKVIYEGVRWVGLYA
jgi:hypothetical protein